MIGLEVIGLEMIGLEMIGLETIGLEMIGLEMIGLEIIGLEMIGLEMIVNQYGHALLNLYLLALCKPVCLLFFLWCLKTEVCSLKFRLTIRVILISAVFHDTIILSTYLK